MFPLFIIIAIIIAVNSNNCSALQEQEHKHHNYNSHSSNKNATPITISDQWLINNKNKNFDSVNRSGRKFEQHGNNNVNDWLIFFTKNSTTLISTSSTTTTTVAPAKIKTTTSTTTTEIISYCNDPGRPTKSQISPVQVTYTEGETVVYSCDNFVSLKQYRKCVNGRWQGEIPICGK